MGWIMQNDGPALYDFGVTILMPTQNLKRLILGYVNDDLTAKATLIKCGNDGHSDAAAMVKTRIEAAASAVAVTVTTVK